MKNAILNTNEPVRGPLMLSSTQALDSLLFDVVVIDCFVVGVRIKMPLSGVVEGR